MRSFLLLSLLAACATAQPAVQSCPVCPACEPAPFQVIGEARMALTDSYGLMTIDEEAQHRIAVLDYILIANFHFLAGHDERYQSLAACTTLALTAVLPDMAVFASPDNVARIKRAHEMFSAMGGTCDDLKVPAKAPTGTEDETIDHIIESEDGERLDLGPSLRNPPSR